MKVKLPKPLTYQQDIIEMLNDDSVKFVTFLKSRQTGGSYLNKLLTLKWGLESGNKIGFITPTYKLSRLFFKELCEAAKPLIAESNSTDLIIKFITGSNVQFFSAEAKDAIRGFQFSHLIIDEAAFIPDSVYYEVIHATHLIKGKKVILCSTPNSNQGFFYNYYEYGTDINKPNYRNKKVTIYDNVFVSQTDIDEIKSTLPDRIFRQEYMAEFLTGDGAVFTNFRNCINNKPIHNGVYYAAIDWAKTDDYTVLTVMNSLKQIVEIYRINKLDYTLQVKLITTKLNHYRPRITISEENNIGSVVNELLKQEYNGVIKQITLDHQEKKDIIENLVVGFEQGDISILENEHLLRELSIFTATYNHQTKKIKYSAPSGMHDDMVISLAYVYSLLRTKKGRYSVL